MKPYHPLYFRLMVISCVTLLSACATTIEPWVKPYERSHLADPIMSQSRNPVTASYMKHVLESREGARGAEGGAGGGCGCN
jgi:hypothetical protein